MKRLHYKKLFLYGAYLAIMILTVVASAVDLVVGNYEDAVIDIFFGSMTFIAYKKLFLHKDIIYAAVALFWIATLAEYLYLFIHSVDFNIIFALLIPIIAFITLPKKIIVYNLFFYYVSLFFLFAYYFTVDKENMFLHNTAYMISYLMAHLFIIAFGIFYYLAIDESLKRLERSNQNQALLLKEVHHRVKNNLNLVSSILGLQTDRAKSLEQRYFLEENQKRIESMAILHEILYSRGMAMDADLKEYVETLVKHIVASSVSRQIEVKTDIAGIVLPMDSMIQLGIMLNEMMINSIKHAADNTEEVNITIRFNAVENGYMLHYCDNASTIDTKRLEEGFGYHLIVLTARHFHAAVHYDTTEGFCYRVVFETMERR
jgi:two-component sensor histidine kinase